MEITTTRVSPSFFFYLWKPFPNDVAILIVKKMLKNSFIAPYLVSINWQETPGFDYCLIIIDFDFFTTNHTSRGVEYALA